MLEREARPARGVGGAADLDRVAAGDRGDAELVLQHGEMLVELAEELGGEPIVVECEHQLLVIGVDGSDPRSLLECAQQPASMMNMPPRQTARPTATRA